MRKKKTFEQAKKEIYEKYSYLELLEFNGNEKSAIFSDKEYGEFEGNYRTVLIGRKNHPKRGKINKKEKTKKTNLKRYGCTAPSQNKEIQEKIKKTNLKKYGVERPLQNKNIYNKIKKTNLKKYGVESALQNKLIKEKVKQTNLERYGCENPTQNKKIREKVKQTNLEKYGVEYISQSKEIREKIKQTCLKKYGVENPQQNKNIKEKAYNTNLEKYGVKNPFQSKEIQENIKKTNLKNGKCHNVNGISLTEYYKNSELNKFAYSTVQQNYIKYGKRALKKDHYNQLHKKSKIADLWLESIEKELDYKLIREYRIPTTLYRADGYDPKTNTIYEFHGDFWHGNLEKYSKTDLHPIKDKTFKELHSDTIKKENKIKSLGYNLIYIWENDFNLS